MKNRVLVVLALAMALVGCGSIRQKPESTTPVAAASAPKQSLPAVPTANTAAASAPQVRTRTEAVDPSKFSSLQPFKKFKKGEGHGVARKYYNRTKAQFIALLRDPELAKKEMRVPCGVLVRQMVEAHPDLQLPFESCEGAAAAIAGDEYQVVPCQDTMFQRDNWLTVTNAGGSAWGVWHRKCLPGERVLVYKDVPLASMECLNGGIPVEHQISVPATMTETPSGICPQGWWLTAYASRRSDLHGDLRQKADELMRLAKSPARYTYGATRLAAYDTKDSLSRELGERIKKEVPRAPVDASIAIRFVDKDPQGNLLVRHIGNLQMVNGVGVPFRLPEDPRLHIVDMGWPAGFISPEISGGESRLRISQWEWTQCHLYAVGLVP